MKSEFLVFGAPDIQSDEINEVVDCLESGWLGTGPKVARFEREFAAYKGIPEANVAAVNSCTAALQLSMIAAGLNAGEEVITTPLTFCATVNAIIHAGATPVLADIDPATMNIDPERIEEAITPKTRAIIPVHFAGRPCDMTRIMAIAEKHGLRVIEDCAHAIETEVDGRKAGTLGDFACFSFYVTKNVATGEGGMVTARSHDDIGKVKVLALHGMSRDAWRRFSDSGFKHYQVVECGFKFNMMDIQAALGIHQLARVEGNWGRRQEIWNQYQEAFAGLPVTTPLDPAPNSRHAYHLYTLLIDEQRLNISRDRFLDEMTDLGIGTGVHYRSVAEHPYYQERFGWRPESFPHAQAVGRQTVSLPLSSSLRDDDISRVVSGVRQVLGCAP